MQTRLMRIGNDLLYSRFHSSAVSSIVLNRRRRGGRLRHGRSLITRRSGRRNRPVQTAIPLGGIASRHVKRRSFSRVSLFFLGRNERCQSPSQSVLLNHSCCKESRIENQEYVFDFFINPLIILCTITL